MRLRRVGRGRELCLGVQAGHGGVHRDQGRIAQRFMIYRGQAPHHLVGPEALQTMGLGIRLRGGDPLGPPVRAAKVLDAAGGDIPVFLSLLTVFRIGDDSAAGERVAERADLAGGAAGRGLAG